MNSIRTKIFVSHLLLVSLVIVGITYYNYKNAVSSLIKSSIDARESSIVSLVSYISDAATGSNYARLLLPSFKSDLSKQHGLRYLLVNGKSSFNNQPISIAYDRDSSLLWRVHFEKNYAANLNQRIKRLEERKSDKNADLVKVNFLLERLGESKDLYEKSKAYNATNLMDLNHFRSKGLSHVDLEREYLYVKVLLKNGYAGHAELLFDISDITRLKRLFIEDSIREFIVTIFLSIPLLMFLSFSISTPLKALSEHMKGSISELEHQSTPGLRRQDEIGELSRQFSKLIDNVARQNRELDDLSRRDPLTGLLNRRSLTEKLQLLRKEHPEKMLCGLYIDIDHFKAYNDTYGHIYGDNALVLVSGELDAFAREKSGFAFRLGGEEFMLVLTADNEDQGFNHAQDLCERVEEMGIPHSGGTDSKCITVSIGLACTKEEKITEEVTQNVLVRADKALYSAKELGRNLVQMYSTKYQDPAN